MGKVDPHLEIELLSALADGELDLSAARKAQLHLSRCGDCAKQLATFSALDRALTVPAPVPCASALELRSALMDLELTPGEAAVASAHLAACERCRAEHALWSRTETTLREMPAASPSGATDVRIARLTRGWAGRANPSALPRAVGALAIRGAVAFAVVLAILIGLAPGDAPQQGGIPSPEEALVAAVQQHVLYSRTNTLYVLNRPAAAVDARDATTYALRTQIAIGGRPTALALNEAASVVLVLDAEQRALVEIDPHRNAVVGTFAIDGIGGKPTSVHVDASSGKVHVAAIPDPPTVGGPAPTPTLDAAHRAPGIVAVIDPAKKLVETIKSVDVAPRVVVTDPNGKQMLLVSAGATTIVDASYRTVRTLPGGVAGAFSARGVIAVLAADGPNAAVVYFSGDSAPGPLRVQGVPLAVTSVPEVNGFAVLLASGGGNSRIVVVDDAGRAVATLPAGASARDLTYDPIAKKLVSVGGGRVASAELPAGVIAAAPASVESSVPATSRPSRSAPPASAPDVLQGSPSASPSAPSSVSPGPSVSPVTSPQPSAVAALPARPLGVPESATMVRPDLWMLDLDGRVPTITAASAKRIWFVDAKNGLGSVDMGTGTFFTFSSFPRDAQITALAVGATTVYAADGKFGRLFTFDIATERVSSRTLPYLRANITMLVAPDGRLWLGMDESAQLLTLDPVTSRLEAVDTQLTGLVALAMDHSARVWFADGDRTVGSYDLRTRRLEHVKVPGKGAARALLPDPSGSIWLGTTAGEVISIMDGKPSVVAMTGRPITRLALDTSGVAWYLTPAPQGTLGYVYAPIRGSGEPRIVAAPVTSLHFSIARAAWLADATGTFYIDVGASR